MTNALQRLLKFIVVLLLVGTTGVLNAQKVLVLEDDQPNIVLEPEHVLVLEDSTHQLGIKDIIQHDAQFHFVEKGKMSNTKGDKVSYWLKFKLKNNSTIGQYYYLESFSPNTESFTLYIPTIKGGYIEKSSSDTMSFNQRELENINLLFGLSGLKIHAEPTTYYVKIRSASYSGFNLHVRASTSFMAYTTKEYFFLGMFYGILLIMVIYNLLVYFSVRNKLYLFYIIYVLSSMLSTLPNDGLGYQFIWPSHPEFNVYLGYHIGPLALLVSFGFYFIFFMDLKRIAPQYLPWVGYTIGGYLTFYVLKLVLLYFNLLPDIFHGRVLYIVPFIILYVIAFKLYRKGYRAGRFFVWGYSFILFGILMRETNAIMPSVLPGTIFVFYAFNFGLLIEVVILSFALAERIKYIVRDKETAQNDLISQLRENEALKTKVNRELEQKVNERTQQLHSKNEELNKSNVKLEELSKKLGEMSSKLDLDNSTLRRSVRASLMDRISNREVSLEEFKMIFPDEKACFLYINDIKWKQGEVQCSKCGHKDLVEGPKKFSKKCTSCAYVESLTANTLYHGLKFPIEKAFYLTYIFFQEKGYTLDELSAIIDLRRNTVWSFKKKVQTTLDVLPKNCTWCDLILVNNGK